MEGARKESLANSADGGCPASLLLQPAIKIYSVKLLVYFFRPVWVKFDSDDSLRVLYSFFLPFLTQEGMWQFDVTAKTMLSVECSSAIRRLFLALPPAIFKSLTPAVSTDSGSPLQPPFFSCRLFLRCQRKGPCVSKETSVYSPLTALGISLWQAKHQFFLKGWILRKGFLPDDHSQNFTQRPTIKPRTSIF